MPGIFESRDLKGSSLQGESFTTNVDPSKAIGTLVNAGLGIYGEHVVDKAKQEIGQVEQDFLNSSSQNRKDEATIDELRKIDSTQGAIYDQANKEIKKLQDSINLRGVNPAEAQSRIEAAKTKYAAKAPMFAREIKNISTDTTVQFKEETKQLIKETNAVRNEMVSLGLNPDIPSNLQQYQEYKASERNAKYVTNRTVIDSSESAAKVQPIIEGYLKNYMGVLDNALNKGLENLDELSLSDRTQLVKQYQFLTNGNEESLARQALSAVGIDMRYVNKDVIASATNMIKGRAEAAIKALNGQIPKEMADYDIELAKNNVLQEVRKVNPGTFAYITLLPYVKGSIAETAIGETGGNDLKTYLTYKGLGNLNFSTLSGMKTIGVKDPKSTQDLYADALDKSMESWRKLNPDVLDKNTFDGYMGDIIKDINHMMVAPQEYTPKMFDMHISRINDPVYMEWFKKLSPVQAKRYKDAVLNATVSYARNKMSDDINNELNKTVGPFQVRRLVSPNFDTSTGTIRFVPNTKGDNEAFYQTASREADRLNKMYASRIDSIGLTAKNYDGLKDVNQEKQFMALLFNDVFRTAGKVLTTKPEDILETNRKIFLQDARAEGLDLPDNATIDEIIKATNDVAKKEKFKYEYDKLRKQTDPFYGYSPDAVDAQGTQSETFQSLVNQVISATVKNNQSQQ